MKVTWQIGVIAAMVLTIALLASTKSCSPISIKHDSTTVIREVRVQLPQDTIYVPHIVGRTISKTEFVTLTGDSVYRPICKPFAFEYKGNGDTISGVANCSDSSILFLRIHAHQVYATLHDTTTKVHDAELYQPTLRVTALALYAPNQYQGEIDAAYRIFGNLSVTATANFNTALGLRALVGVSIPILQQ